jgi:hypothetical protein
MKKQQIFSKVFCMRQRKYYFERISQGKDDITGNFYNKLYNGKTKLYARYEKKIEKLAEGKYDKFFQVNSIFIFKEGTLRYISGKKDFFRLFSENRKAIKNYIKINKRCKQFNKYFYKGFICCLKHK